MRAAKRVIKRKISKNATAAGSSADVMGEDVTGQVGGKMGEHVERTPFNPTGQAEVPSAQKSYGQGTWDQITEPSSHAQGPQFGKRMLPAAISRNLAVFAAKARARNASDLIRLESPLEPSDSDLARRIGQGERWAEEAFYRRHVVQVVGIAQRLLGNGSDAEDVAQETFTTAFEIWHQLRDYERARPWLLQIAVRKVHRKFRKRRVLRLLGLDQSLDDLPLEVLAHEDTSAEVRSDLRLLDSVLKSLSAKSRIPWMLRYIEGLPLEEVAAQCDCSLATAKRRIADAHRLVSRQVSMGEVET